MGHSWRRWAYQGVDSNSSTQAERDQVSLQINHALSRMGSGWMIHIDAVRKPAPGLFRQR